MLGMFPPGRYEPSKPTVLDRKLARNCPECNGWVFIVRLGRWVRHRETAGLVCQRCGWDYGVDGEP